MKSAGSAPVRVVQGGGGAGRLSLSSRERVTRRFPSLSLDHCLAFSSPFMLQIFFEVDLGAFERTPLMRQPSSSSSPSPRSSSSLSSSHPPLPFSPALASPRPLPPPSSLHPLAFLHSSFHRPPLLWAELSCIYESIYTVYLCIYLFLYLWTNNAFGRFCHSLFSLH